MKEKKIVLHTLSTQDDVVWKPQNRSISILFQKKRKVLSTSLLNGGYHEGLTGIFNHNCGPEDGKNCRLLAETYHEHLQIIARDAGLIPELSTGMGTAALMENVAIVVKEYHELAVTAIVTAGIEGNGGRVGDPTDNYYPIEKTTNHKPGTINIILVLDADMPPGTLTRALVTCTEAKTAALQELMAGSLYSNGLATGSGTDQSIIVANPQSPLYFEGAGKHSKLGELIGLAVKEAVKNALFKQTGLSAEKQHSVLRRFKRFGINEDTLWHYYLSTVDEKITKNNFNEALAKVEKEPQIVVYVSMYIHLLDQLQWELLSLNEIIPMANDILKASAEIYGQKAPVIRESAFTACLQAWSELMCQCLRKELMQIRK